jgi:hypothetical protein
MLIIELRKSVNDNATTCSGYNLKNLLRMKDVVEIYLSALFHKTKPERHIKVRTAKKPESPT